MCVWSFPMPVSKSVSSEIGEILTRHAKDIGAMLGKRARAHGTRENAREIEHADAGERTLAPGQRLGVAPRRS